MNRVGFGLISKQDLTTIPRPPIRPETRLRLLKPSKQNSLEPNTLSQTTPNPSVRKGQYSSSSHLNLMTNGSGFAGKSASRRYYAAADDGQEWPPELHDYNKRFAKVLEGIKRRHDSVVTTVGESSLSWAVLDTAESFT